MTQVYSSDFDGYLLKTQLEVLSTDFAANSESRRKYQLSDVIELLKSKSKAQNICYLKCALCYCFWLCLQQMPLVSAASVHYAELNHIYAPL